MKYILNESPIRTSNNFRINDIKLDLELPTKSNFKGFKTNNLDGVSINYEYGKSFNSKIGISINDSCKSTINISKSLDEPLIIEYEANNSIIDLDINTKTNINANIIIKVIGNSTNLLIINTYVKESSNITINYINMNKGYSLISFVNNEEENSITTYNIYDLCGELRIYNYENNGNKSNTKNYINNMYIVGNNELLDMNYYIKHKGIETFSNINVLGCLKDKSNKSFKGTIDFIEGSKKSKGRVYEDVISLSDDAVSKSLPMILCHEEDVEGSHGVSTGKIDDELLFYIESRGLSKEDSIKLIMNTKFNKYINLLSNNELKEEITDIINRSI